MPSLLGKSLVGQVGEVFLLPWEDGERQMSSSNSAMLGNGAGNPSPPIKIGEGDRSGPLSTFHGDVMEMREKIGRVSGAQTL